MRFKEILFLFQIPEMLLSEMGGEENYSDKKRKEEKKKKSGSILMKLILPGFC